VSGAASRAISRTSKGAVRSGTLPSETREISCRGAVLMALVPAVPEHANPPGMRFQRENASLAEGKRIVPRVRETQRQRRNRLFPLGNAFFLQ
jgi:hypothetical protein